MFRNKSFYTYLKTNVYSKAILTNVSINKMKYLNISRKNVDNNKKLLHTTFQKLKYFAENENVYAHEILEKCKNYTLFTKPNIETERVIPLDDILKLDSSNSPEEFFENFKCLALYCQKENVCISDDRFDKFVDIFTEKCPNFTDEQLLDSIRFLTILPLTLDPVFKNFIELWTALDVACCDRLENWDIDKSLLYSDCWYSLRLARKGEFVWKAVRKIGRKVKKLEIHQLVHSIFFTNLLRKSIVEMMDYEVAWHKLLNQMNIKEIGIMSMGFFKTETPIRNPELVEDIYKRLMNELDTVEDITLVNILKILRYSSKIPQADIMSELLEKMCPYIDKVSLLSCLHIGLLGCDIQFCHNKCIELIIERFSRDIEKARLKDLERIAHIMSLFNVHSESGIEHKLCKQILQKLPSVVKEIVQHPKCFPACLHYLSICGYHNEEFISIVLDDRYMRHAYGNNLLLGREVFCLDAYTRINLAGTYSGTRLSEKRLNSLGKYLTNYIPERNQKYKLSVTDRILLEVKEACENLFRVCSIKHVLPHFQRPDIIVCFDKTTKQAIRLGNNCHNDYSGTILAKDKLFDDNVNIENIETIVLLVAGWNNLLRSQSLCTGLIQLKINQLDILGHKAIMIPWYEWREQENKVDRQNYIRRKFSAYI